MAVAQPHDVRPEQQHVGLQQRAEEPEIGNADNREQQHPVAAQALHAKPDFAPGIEVDAARGRRCRHTGNAEAERRERPAEPQLRSEERELLIDPRPNARVAGERRKFLTGGEVPELHAPVVTAGRQRPAVGGEGDAADVRGVAGERGALL